MMQALELQQLVKGTFRNKEMFNTAKIKPIALAVIELHLSEGISKSVSRKSVKKENF